MSDYSSGKIYAIYCNTSGKVYIGSTKNKLGWRFNKHKYERNLESTSSWKLDLDNAVIVLLENYPCDNRRQLEVREQYWMNKYPAVNRTRSHQTHEQMLYKEKMRKRDQRQFKSSWAYNNNIYGFRLCLLDIDPTLFE